MRYLATFLTLSILCGNSNAQEIDQTEYPSELYEKIFPSSSGKGDVKIIQEKKLDEVMLYYIGENMKSTGIPLYWIRIYSGSRHGSREEAYETKGLFMQEFDSIRNTVIYDDPNFKVYVGGYRTKSEALRLLNRIKRSFMNPFIVYDAIALPEI